jgi:hypothetical protein
MGPDSYDISCAGRCGKMSGRDYSGKWPQFTAFCITIAEAFLKIIRHNLLLNSIGWNSRQMSA